MFVFQVKHQSCPMEKVLVTMLLVACFGLQELDSADAFTIGILHDPNDGKADDISAALNQVEPLVTSSPHANITFLYFPVPNNSEWTVCQLVNSNATLALIVIGSCQFHRELFLRTETPLPWPLVLVEIDSDGTRCGYAEAWGSRVFRDKSRHLWFPHVVADLLAFLRASELVVVTSAEFVRLASSTVEHLSMQHVSYALVPVDRFRDPHLHNSTLQHKNAADTTIPILLAVNQTDVDFILSHYGSDTEHWIVFTGDTTINMSNSSRKYLFYIVPTFPATAQLSAELFLDEMGAHVYTIVKLLEASYNQLQSSQSQDTMNSSSMPCGDLNVSVSSDAARLKHSLSRGVFDDDGYLQIVLYDVEVTGPEGVVPAGHWNVSSGLTMSQNMRTKFIYELLVSNSTLIIGTEMAEPFVMRDNNTWYGFCIDMLDELADRMGFKYELRRSVDNMWGAKNLDGSWNGLIGMAVRKEIDMAIGPISVSAERETAVDFTKPYMESAAGMMLRKYEDTTTKMFRTLMPFTLNVWLTLAGVLVVIGCIFAFINRFSPIKGKPGDEDADRYIASIGDSFWVVFGSFMEQDRSSRQRQYIGLTDVKILVQLALKHFPAGAERFPHSVAGRVVLGLWWVFTILITASYTASLAAFLTFNMAQVPINSLEDLAGQSDILPLIENGTNLYSLFKKGDTATHRKIYEMISKSPLINSSEHGANLTLSGPYALMTDREQLDLLQKRDCESLVQADEHFNTNGLGFFVQEGSELLEPLSTNMIKLMEAGLIDKWRRKWWSAKDVCTDSVVVSSVVSLKLDSTAGPFILYAVSTVMAVVVLVGERALNALWPLYKASRARKADGSRGDEL